MEGIIVNSGNLLFDIISLCRENDAKAASIYYNFSLSCKDDTLRSIWEKMQKEEKAHVGYWQHLLNLVKAGAVPQLFEDPEQIKKELEALIPKINGFLVESKYPINSSIAFQIACNLELFMLGRPFIYLHIYLQSIIEGKSPADDYERHLTEFIENLNRYGLSPETKIFGDVIQRIWKENNKLAIQSVKAPLTGLFNRRGFTQTIRPLAYMAQRQGNNVGILMIDVDNFKGINDKYGHQTGDEVLKFISYTTQLHIRHSDIAGRYGGEEFIVFLPNVEPDKLYSVAEKIRSNIENGSHFDFPIKVSIGAAQRKLDQDVESELYAITKSADDLLYTAKKTGKNKVVTA